MQLGTGYTVGYLVYTVGTLIVDPAALHVGAAIGGGLFVLALVGVLVWLCIKADKEVKTESVLRVG